MRSRILTRLGLSPFFDFLSENNVRVAATNFGKEERKEGPCDATTNEDCVKTRAISRQYIWEKRGKTLTPEDGGGAYFRAEGIEDERRDDGADFATGSGDTVSKSPVTGREDFSGVALRKKIKN